MRSNPIPARERTCSVSDLDPTALTAFAEAKDAIIDALKAGEWNGFDNGCGYDRYEEEDECDKEYYRQRRGWSQHD